MPRSAAVAATALLVALSACSGGSAASSTTTTTTTTTVSSTTTTVVATTTTLAVDRRPTVAAEPSALAAQLMVDELALRDASTAPTALVDAARRQQVAYRVWSRHPEWDATVMAAVPAGLTTAVQRNIDARRQFVTMASTRPVADTVPPWRIVAPAPADALLADYHEAESAFGVGWEYLAAINLVETGMGRIVGLSTAGAQGPMQFMPATWERYGAGGDVNAPHDAILGAARYLEANGFTQGNIDGALHHYNQSDEYVAAVKDYAAILEAEPALLAGYHAWDVYYFTTLGDVLLPVGYEAADRVPVADYLAAHPQ